MVDVIYTERFEKAVKKIKDEGLKARVKKQIAKIVANPEVGKPLRYCRKGERSLRVKPYRLIYAYKEDTIYLLDLGHRDGVYG